MQRYRDEQLRPDGHVPKQLRERSVVHRRLLLHHLGGGVLQERELLQRLLHGHSMLRERGDAVHRSFGLLQGQQLHGQYVLRQPEHELHEQR